VGMQLEVSGKGSCVAKKIMRDVLCAFEIVYRDKQK
jgi:hypothetical protein